MSNKRNKRNQKLKPDQCDQCKDSPLRIWYDGEYGIIRCLNCNCFIDYFDPEIPEEYSDMY